MSALGDAFKAHTVGFLVAGVFLAWGVEDTLKDIFAPHTLPETMECVASDSKAPVSNGFHISIGFDHETKLNIPADQLQKIGPAPVSFVCTAK
jgi:hypothetical protein